MPTRSQIQLAVACPMANEGAGSVRFTREVLAQCTGFAGTRFFAVFDNVSTDESLGLMREYAREEPRLDVVWAPENRSIVDAYVRGYRAALDWGADWILEIDAGFSHRPCDIPQFFTTMEQGCDCVFGSRFMPGAGISETSFKRYWMSRGGTIAANLMLGTRQSDMTSGFELFTRKTLESVLARGIQSKAHFFQTEIKTYCRRLRFVEVPIHYAMPSARLNAAAVKDARHHLWRLFLMRLKGQL